MCSKTSVCSMLCLVLSTVAVTIGVMAFFKNTRKGRRMVKKAKRLGRDVEDIFSM